MKRRYYIFSFLVLVLASCLSEPKHYHYHIDLESKILLDQAKKLINKDQAEDAIKVLNKIECLNASGCRFKNFYLSRAYSAIDSSKSFKFLKDAVAEGQLRQYIQIEDFDYTMDTVMLHSIEEEYLNRTQSTKLFHELQEVTKSDQKVRKTCRGRSKECIAKINYVDSLNLIVLDSIVNKSGWPGNSSLGYLIPQPFFPQPELVVVHSNEETCRKYLKIIEESCLKNEEYWSAYQSVFSNILMRYNFRKDTVLLDFISDNSFNQLEQKHEVPEFKPITKYLNSKSSAFTIYPVNNTPSEYAQLIVEGLRDKIDHQLNFSESVDFISDCKNCLLLIKN